MKKIFITFLSAMMFISVSSQQPTFDKSLADSLGADKNGMKQYVMVILKTGPNDVKDNELRAQYFKGHFENINRMAEAGKLIVAGPFDTNNQKFRGLFILNVTDFSEAEKLIQEDPTIKEKIFDVEMFHWYGGAALPMYLPYQKKIEKDTP